MRKKKQTETEECRPLVERPSERTHAQAGTTLGAAAATAEKKQLWSISRSAVEAEREGAMASFGRVTRSVTGIGD